MGVALILSVLAAPAAYGSWPGDNGRIVAVEPRYDWESCPDASCNTVPSTGSIIVTQSARGTNKVDLGIGLDPTWNADGTKLAFTSTGHRIRTMRADGSDKRYITSPNPEPGEQEWIDSRPSWSPSGNRIAFQRDWNGRAKKVLIVALNDVANPKVLTTGTRPEWSSRGTIALLRKVDGVQRIYTIRPDGREHHVVPNTARATDVTWSPNGRRLAFVTLRADGSGAECVRVVGIDGFGQRALRCDFKGSDGGDIQGISWSPDGTSILVGIQDFYDQPVYSSGRMVRVSLDTNKTPLGTTGFMPDWQPNP